MSELLMFLGSLLAYGLIQLLQSRHDKKELWRNRIKRRWEHAKQHYRREQ